MAILVSYAQKEEAGMFSVAHTYCWLSASLPLTWGSNQSYNLASDKGIYGDSTCPGSICIFCHSYVRTKDTNLSCGTRMTSHPVRTDVGSSIFSWIPAGLCSRHFLSIFLPQLPALKTSESPVRYEMTALQRLFNQFPQFKNHVYIQVIDIYAHIHTYK